MSDTENRAKFEAWAVQHCAPLVQKREVLARSQDGRYQLFTIEDNWQAWQAAQIAPPIAQSLPMAALEKIVHTNWHGPDDLLDAICKMKAIAQDALNGV